MVEWILIFILLAALIILFVKYSSLKGEIEDRANQLFHKWRDRELTELREEYERQAEEKARVMLEEWRQKEEEQIREDAISRSAATILGKVGEHLAPILIFANYRINPKDLRFIGTPVDFIAFKGLSEETPEEIIFIEVKSGKTSRLTNREKMVRNLIEARQVKWLTIHLPTELEKVLQKAKHKTPKYSATS